MRRGLSLLFLFPWWSAFAAQTSVSFDSLFAGPGEYINDTSVSVGPVTFPNTYSYDAEWDYESWAGFAFSTVSNSTANSHTNQYAPVQALPGACAIGYQDLYQAIVPAIAFDLPVAPRSVRVNNTTYTALTIRDGDEYGFSPPFSEGDFYFLTLTARDGDGMELAATNHVLADFRGTNRLIQTHWITLDLSWMPPAVASLEFTLTTSDIGPYGPNTPMYVALADFTYGYGDSLSGLASTSPAFVCWADGFSDYSPGTMLSNQFRNAEHALGPAYGTPGRTNALDVTGLGEGGSITLTFPEPIADGSGPDFAVFENGFRSSGGESAWCELAFVEVSSDGTNFVRFPSHCLETNALEYWADPTAYGGFAGKHPLGSGTPFDLRALAGADGLDVRRVTHVRIVDIVGDGSRLDAYDNPVYDPVSPVWPYDFDLDAVGVMNINADISLDPAQSGPELPGFTTLLEYTADLESADWTPVDTRDLPGFYRYRLVKP